MYGYEDYYNEEIYEPTLLDELFIEYREKCKTILLTSVQDEINNIKNNNTKLNEENMKLRIKINELKSEIKLLNDNCKNSTVIDKVLENINKDNFYEFLEVLYKKDYEESWSIENTPLWLGVLTEFYYHRNSIIEMMNSFKIKMPNNISDFKLPIDWNEEELDIFFSTMKNHYNCNGSFFEHNLCFWGTNSLNPVKEQCNKNYSEIPWQYVLRNPLLKKEKYLKLMGQYMIKQYVNGYQFARICYYQKLEENEIKIILENINYSELKSIKRDISSFILGHIHLIDNNDFLDKIYPLVARSYCAFNYIKKMKFEYIKKYLLENKKNALKLLGDLELPKAEKQELIEMIVN